MNGENYPMFQETLQFPSSGYICSVVAGYFWRPYVGQAIGDEFDLLQLIGGAKKWAIHWIIFNI
jgi:hypothetical protein